MLARKIAIDGTTLGDPHAAYGVAPTPLHMFQYCQLHYQFLFGGPHHAPRGTTVELERA